MFIKFQLHVRVYNVNWTLDEIAHLFPLGNLKITNKVEQY